MNRLYLPFIITLIFLFIISCNKEQVIFKEIEFQISEHILPDYFVISIDFDSKGNAWIGTFKQGMIKYNDGQTTIYNSENSLIPDSAVIRDIKVDNYDNIWLGTYGLIKFDGTTFDFFNTQNSPLLENIVWSIGIDKNNIIWLASCRFKQGGLMSFDGTTWKSYTPENSLLPANGVKDIVVDNNNNVWLAMSEIVNNACLVKIRNGEWTIYDDSALGFRPYYFGNLAIGRNNILIASLDYGLSSMWDITRPNIIHFDGYKCTIINPVDEYENSLGYVGVVNTDSEGNIWASIEGNVELAVFNGEKWYYNEPDCPFEGVFAIETDLQDRIWVGTGTGIYIIEK
ncbi:MAG: hypothetical protein KAU83_07195 [Bacteroidales bacterium]|nr:hypothetical protein [Bacteroidales bacterium]